MEGTSSLLVRRPGSVTALAIDHSLTSVSRFNGCVNHTKVGARSTYRPVHGVPVVDAQQVVTAATLGHVAVVCVARASR